MIPALVDVLHMPDSTVQYYSTASLSNIAVTEKYRTMIVAVGHFDAIKQLIKLLSSKSDKVTIKVFTIIGDMMTRPSRERSQGNL